MQGYAHHPLDGRKLYGLTTPSQPAQRPTSSYDELAQFDYGDREGGVYAPGDAVTHERFGSGVIQSLRGSGASTKVEVRFTDGSVRTIIASFLQPDDTMEFDESTRYHRRQADQRARLSGCGSTTTCSAYVLRLRATFGGHRGAAFEAELGQPTTPVYACLADELQLRMLQMRCLTPAEYDAADGDVTLKARPAAGYR